MPDTLVKQVMFLYYPTNFATWQARRDYIADLELQHKPLKLQDLIMLCQLKILNTQTQGQ